jgi:hypothetical protein
MNILDQVSKFIDKVKWRHDRSYKLYAAYEDDFIEILRKHGSLQKEMECWICKRKMSSDEVSCVFPTSEGMKLCCGDVNCYKKVLEITKK